MLKLFFTKGKNIFMQNIETRKKVTEKILEIFMENHYTLEEMHDEIMVLMQAVFSTKNIVKDNEYLQ